LCAYCRDSVSCSAPSGGRGGGVAPCWWPAMWYWVGRLVAFTAGAAFSGGFAPPKEGDSGWIHYLPREAKPSDGCPSAELGKVLCESCRNRCKYKMGDNAHAFVMLQAAAVEAASSCP